MDTLHQLGQSVTTPQDDDIPTRGVNTFTTSYSYDPWGRIRSLTYPDQEQVTYHYGYGGKLVQFYGLIPGNTNKQRYIQTQGFDKRGQRIALDYGNGSYSKHYMQGAERVASRVYTSAASLSLSTAPNLQIDHIMVHSLNGHIH